MTTEEKLDNISAEISVLSKRMQEFRDSPLNRRCILILLQDITKLPLKTIEGVLVGVEELEDHFLKKAERTEEHE
jgi:hypothetical protein